MFLLTGLIMVELTWKIYGLESIYFPSSTIGPCKSTSGKQGWCRDITACPLKDDRTSRSSCGFNGKKPLTCCPVSVDLISANGGGGNIVNFGHIEAPKVNYECGKRDSKKSELSLIPEEVSTKIPHNNSSSIKIEEVPISFPFMVMIGKTKGLPKEFHCTGVLINPNFVLTTAHCSIGSKDLFCRFGNQVNSSSTDAFGSVHEKRTNDVDVNEVFVHPEYDAKKMSNDVALLKLNSKSTVSPICLPWGSLAEADLDGKQAHVKAWVNHENVSGSLEGKTMKIIGQAACENYIPKRQLPEGVTQKDILCALNQEKQENNQVCKKTFSGGPMMVSRTGDERDAAGPTFTLIAFTSEKLGCNTITTDSPGSPNQYIPIRTYNVLQWIKDTAF